VLEFDAAVKHFGSVIALDDCTFAARPGRLTGFLGPNGAGKTTAMRAVFGLVALDSGQVRWCGAPVAHADRSRFGYMPEERGLYPRMRVREQLLYLGGLCGRSPREVGRATDHWLDQLGIAVRANARVDELSHGNQQRVQLIAALVNNPDLLILDEPFAGLDPLAMVAMGGLLKELAETGVTVVFSSHQLDLVEDLCQDVVIVNHGRVVLCGELERLRAASPYRTVDVAFTGPRPVWRGLKHVQVRERLDGSASLRVDRDVDLRRLLAELDLADKVTSLVYQPPTLSDLFTTAVSTPPVGDEAGVAT
jgi:ABC-2 type transport system ATP-binding protein